MPIPAHFKFLSSFAALVLLLAGAPARAQDVAPDDLGPLAAALEEEHESYLGATLESAYDSNVTAQPAGPPVNGGPGAVGSTVDSAGVLGRFDHTYDRQHLVASANFTRNVYLDLPLYNYNAEVLRADLKSNFPSDINTEVAIGRTEHLAAQQDLNSVRRDVISTDGAQAAAYFPVAVDWHALVAGGVAWVDNSDVIDKPTNADTKEGDAGVRYQRSLDNYVDIMGRYASTRYPEANVAAGLNPSYSDRGLDVRTRWKFSGSSMVLGHVGYQERRYNDLTILDAAGPIYELTYTWLPGYKTEFQLYALRQAGAAGDSGYLDGVTHTYRVSPTYLVTDKLRLDLYYQWTRIGYYGDTQQLLNPASVTAATPQGPVTTQAQADQTTALNRTDTQYVYGFMLKWTPLRWLTFNLEAHRQARSSSLRDFNFEDRYTAITAQARI